MSTDPKNSDIQPNQQSEKPVPTKRMMVDLELDDGWLGELATNRIEPVRLKKQKAEQPEPETQNQPEMGTIASNLEELESEVKNDVPLGVELPEPIQNVVEPIDLDPPTQPPIREEAKLEVKDDVPSAVEPLEPIDEMVELIGSEILTQPPIREEAPNANVSEPEITMTEPGLRGEMTMPTAAIQAKRVAPERPIEAVVVDAVGDVPPVVLGAGLLGGLALFVVLAVVGVLVVLYGNFSFSPLPNEPVIERFDDDVSGIWPVQMITDDSSVIIQEAYFVDGGYRITNRVPATLIWSNAGLRLGAGTYQVEIEFATDQAETGAGLAILREDDTFFLVEIGSDGYAWIGRCEQGCAVTEPLVENGWFAVDEINKGLGQTNQLKVEMKRGQMAVFINGIEIGFVEDSRIRGAGDVALLVESGDAESVSAVFDNFEWNP